MAYTVPADPGWDLNALLDKVPELAKKAIAGGLFLGHIDDIADQDDVSAAVVKCNIAYRYRFILRWSPRIYFMCGQALAHEQENFNNFPGANQCQTDGTAKHIA